MNAKINSNEDLLQRGTSMRNRNILGIVLFFTIIGTIPSLIISLIDSIVILSTTYKDENLNEEKTLWGLLSLIILGNIGCLVFATKMIDTANLNIEVEQSTKDMENNTQDIVDKISKIESNKTEV